MRRQRGTTIFEMVTVLAVAGILCAIAVPGAAAVRSAFSAHTAVGTLALLLREAQSSAQSAGLPVEVAVAHDGGFVVRQTAADGSLVVRRRGSLGVHITSNYPGGVVVFVASGLPTSPGSASPRAGRFTIGGHAVIVQLGGCIRCI